MNVKELAEQAGFDKHHIEYDTRIKKLDELIRADEREACAKLCEDEADQISNDQEAGGMYWCAEKIRARSKHD